MTIKESPDLPVHFLLNKIDYMEDDEEMIETIEDTIHKIKKYFPKAELMPYTSKYANNQQSEQLALFIDQKIRPSFSWKDREKKLLTAVEEVLTDLRYEPNRLKVKLNKEIKELQHESSVIQLDRSMVAGNEEESLKKVQQSFYQIKADVVSLLKKELPNQLKECAVIVQPDSDFRNIHLAVNEEMNKRVNKCMNGIILPFFRKRIGDWLIKWNRHFEKESIRYTNLPSIQQKVFTGNAILDHHFLHKWQKELSLVLDLDRSYQVDFMLRANISSFILKGAGRLFGSSQHRNTLIYNQYQKFIRTESYEDVVISTADHLFLQMKTFEKQISDSISFYYMPVSKGLSMVAELFDERKIL